MSTPVNTCKANLPGLTSILAEAAATSTIQDDIAADLEEEQATLPHDSTLFDNEDDDDNDDFSEGRPMNLDDDSADIDNHNDHDSGMPGEWKESMKEASKGVTDKTHNEYLRLASACTEFLMANNLISQPDDFLSPTPLLDSDQMIVAWIMDS
ncbi:hypothetical protein CPB84DRAFT_1844528 [Gymnopilus junonius]|uniref:Uncharacterized protein n=1 Tax=Gymnopilus junonius TaxID=109634 RepID=A0A9P5NTZ8_GYMJU|nr:hypothetical protein CPB84DRAFT_1844528 [Gymnopilus junonius]